VKTRPSGNLRKKGYHHNDLRNALLTTALDLIVSRGGPNFSMRELASALGVTHTSVYRHFSDKAALLDALTAEGFRTLAAYQDEELNKASREPLERVNALGFAYLRFAQENKGFFSLMFTAREDENPEQSSRTLHNERALSTLIGAITECQEAGIIVDGDPVRMAGFLVLATHGLAVYQTQGHHPLGNGNDVAFFPDIEAVNELSIIPLLANPPKPEDVAKHWFSPIEAAD
jgi:AcrR family transcriptional regulator